MCFSGPDGFEIDIEQVSDNTCIAQLGKVPDEVNDYVTISFFETAIIEGLLGQSAVTASVFEGIKNDSHNTNNISNLGNSAFTALDDTSDFSTRVRLYVRYSTMILTFDLVYENATGPHCANDHDELIKLARIVLANLAS